MPIFDERLKLKTL